MIPYGDEWRAIHEAKQRELEEEIAVLKEENAKLKIALAHAREPVGWGQHLPGVDKNGKEMDD